jgi:hypothetical protein
MTTNARDNLCMKHISFSRGEVLVSVFIVATLAMIFA